MTFSWNRILSALLAVIYMVGAFVTGGAENGFKVLGFVILPLACIWFGEAMGGYTGPTTIINITAPTPGLIVCMVGWVLLIVPLLFVLL